VPDSPARLTKQAFSLMDLGWPLARPKKSLLPIDSEKAHMC